MVQDARNRLAGYAFLIERYRLKVLPNWHSSSVGQTGTLRSAAQDGVVVSTYPQSYWPGDSVGEHLEFALKYDGVNLGILSAVFDALAAGEITAWIASKPTGKHARRIWYLYEFLAGSRLALPDLKKGNYVSLLDPGRYYVTSPGRRVGRQRVIDNLLGGRSFCPVVRRTQKLVAMESMDLRRRCEDVLTEYSPGLLKRALSYLYNKETKSTFEIEQIRPSPSRVEKFIGLLEMAEHEYFLDKALLIDLQNRIVDPRFRASDYREDQNYVGQTVSYQNELVHYVCPKPGDLPDLMDGLLACHRMMKDSAVPALVHAAAVSYGFVFMHPFDDGNGRIHRFLIHNILFLRGEVPNGLMFPVSAAMLRHSELYDSSLEVYSAPLMRLVEYELDDLGRMTVIGDTGRWYRYIDMTIQAEALCDFVRLTIEQELLSELDFLARYDETRQAIQEIVDMPDRLIDLFIRLCLQNNGRPSATKRTSHFDFLTDDELGRMEEAVRVGYGK